MYFPRILTVVMVSAALFVLVLVLMFGIGCDFGVECGADGTGNVDTEQTKEVDMFSRSNGGVGDVIYSVCVGSRVGVWCNGESGFYFDVCCGVVGIAGGIGQIKTLDAFSDNNDCGDDVSCGV